MMAGPRLEYWRRGVRAQMPRDLWARFCAAVAVTVAGHSQFDAGDSDARHFADGHLEQ